MKLGEALQVRSDNYKRIDQLRARALGSAVIQEGEKPADNPKELLALLEILTVETLELVQRIHRTNVRAKLSTGKALVDALAERDSYLALRAQLESVAKAAAEPVQRHMRSELRLVRMVDPAAIRKRVDELSQKFRELDVAIQEANWSTELL